MPKTTPVCVGMDVGDRFSELCWIDSSGEVVRRGRLRTRRAEISEHLSGPPVQVALEVGTHSPWIARLLEDLGHRVVVANPRKVRLIYQSDRKTDKNDAEVLARLARVDSTLLCPVRHRDEKAQSALAVLHSRERLVETRTKLINHVRGTVKAVGSRLRSCSTKCFHSRAAGQIPETLRSALEPVLKLIEGLTVQIRRLDREIERLIKETYPEAGRLLQPRGVGPITALAYVLVIQTPERFRRSRDVGPYLGLVPRRDQSGQQDRELHITKAGSPLLRKLLVHCAHYILGPFGEDSDLRRWGLKQAGRGSKGAKKRAVVAVARKLAVLLHRLWQTGRSYEPLYRAERQLTA